MILTGDTIFWVIGELVLFIYGCDFFYTSTYKTGEIYLSTFFGGWYTYPVVELVFVATGIIVDDFCLLLELFDIFEIFFWLEALLIGMIEFGFTF